jgi:hypothetical protein
MSVIHHHHDHPRRREANKDRAALEEQLSMAGENVRRGIEHVRKHVRKFSGWSAVAATLRRIGKCLIPPRTHYFCTCPTVIGS